MRRFIGLVVLGIVTLQFGCGGSSNSSLPPLPRQEPIVVSLTPTTSTVNIGQTQQFEATVSKTSNTVVAWQVNGTTGGTSAVGTITATGMYTAPATEPNPSSVTVTAVSQADNTKSASASITIRGPISLGLSPEMTTLEVGGLQQYVATATFSNGANQDVTGLVKWSSSSTATAAPQGIAGRIMGLEEGTVTVTASLSSLSGSATLVVTRDLTRRYGHAATKLSDGNVLITGGVGPVHPLALAALYNDAQDSFVAVGSMLQERAFHTATLLSDGKVLIVGGMHQPGGTANFVPLSSVELYDPATKEFTFVGDLSVARYDHSATLLTNGEVLITGGHGSLGPVSSAEVYDPLNRTLFPTEPMTQARSRHTATRLSNGTVLLVGGCQYPNNCPQAELYDPATSSFEPSGALMVPRAWGHTANLLKDGRVLISGGSYFGSPATSAELYDPVTGQFSNAGEMAVPRSWHTSTLLIDGRVLIAGGSPGNTQTATSLTEVFDPASITFTLTDPMLAPRSVATATRLNNGSVLIVGGISGTMGIGSPVAGREILSENSTTLSSSTTTIRAGEVSRRGSAQ